MQAVISVVMELYAGATTKISITDGYTDAIPLTFGVKQGDSLSSILYNLAMEPEVRALQRAAPEYGYPMCCRHFSVVACAVDLAMLAVREPHLKALLYIAGWVADWAGLKFNARKRASLDIDCTARR